MSDSHKEFVSKKLSWGWKEKIKKTKINGKKH